MNDRCTEFIASYRGAEAGRTCYLGLPSKLSNTRWELAINRCPAKRWPNEPKIEMQR